MRRKIHRPAAGIAADPCLLTACGQTEDTGDTEWEYPAAFAGLETLVETGTGGGQPDGIRQLPRGLLTAACETFETLFNVRVSYQQVRQPGGAGQAGLADGPARMCGSARTAARWSESGVYGRPDGPMSPQRHGRTVRQ